MTGRQTKRTCAGRPKGSKNKMTIAREAVAEILDVEDAKMLSAEVHKRGHTLLSEMERIAIDPTQPVAARIMAAKVALPFLLPRRETTVRGSTNTDNLEHLISLMRARREQLARLRLSPHEPVIHSNSGGNRL
jgi:hypothetical protein